MARSLLILAVQITLWAALASASAQSTASGVAPQLPGTPLDGNALDERARQQRIAITGTLGFPPLPPITADSPRNSMLYADRLPYGAPADSGGTLAATMTTKWVPSELTGTGFAELIHYQLPDGYTLFGPAHPMVIAYHGFGASASSPAGLSTLDEEANARNWIYVSVTGIDDQLFGTPISQQNTYAAIQYMIDNHNVDPDRLYMVGFSLGAAISANFAARHRDPSGIMIAALGLVSCTGDWVMEYTMADSALQTWMENPFNFDGPPSTELFAYQASSLLHDDTASYPPLSSAVALTSLSMATNLGPVPTYITYDDQDTLPQVPILCEQLDTTLQAVGATTEKVVVSGTVIPGIPPVSGTHSWEVLDEAGLFDFFDGKTANREPADFSAQQDLSAAVSWASTVQDTEGEFTYLDATVNTAAKLITISEVSNADELHVDVSAAGLSGAMPYRVQVTNTGLNPTRLYLTGFPDSPSYMKVPLAGSLITLVDSDPTGGPTGNGTLSVEIPAGTTSDLKVVHDPTWVTKLTTSPNPASIGASLDFTIDGPPADTNAYLVVAAVEMFTPVDNLLLTAFPGPPSIIRFLPLDAAGDFSFTQTVPNQSTLLGLRFPTQVVTTDAQGTLQTVSNLWGLYIAP